MVVRRQAALERLMARLTVAVPERWALKGGLALDTRLGDHARASMDMDIDHAQGDVAAREDLVRATQLNLGDYFGFAVVGAREVQDEGLRLATRYSVVSSVGGPHFETVQVDVTVTPPEVWEVERAQRPGLLAPLGFAPVEVFLTPLDRQVAEKLHAYTRTYGGGRRSTRVKDLVDLTLIRLFERVQADRLRDAIDRTFASRATHTIPQYVPTPPDDWGPAYREEATRVGITPDLPDAQRFVATWLDPVLQGTAQGEWDPEKGIWTSKPSLP